MIRFPIRQVFRGCPENKQEGGAAVEYIVVSIFGLLLAFAAIGMVAKTVKAKLQKFEEKVGIEWDDSVLDVVE